MEGEPKEKYDFMSEEAQKKLLELEQKIKDLEDQTVSIHLSKEEHARLAKEITELREQAHKFKLDYMNLF